MVKTLKNLLLQNQKASDFETWYDKDFLLTSKVCLLWVVYLCPGAITCIKSWKKNCIKSGFKDIFWKLATNEWSHKTFVLTSKLCPLGAVCTCPSDIYMYKIMKKMYKIRLQRDFFETCNRWPKWQDVPVDIKISSPRGCQSLPWGYIHVQNHEKFCIKSDFKEIIFKLVVNDQSDKRFLLSSKFCPLGLSAPDPSYIHLLNHKKMCIKSGGRDSF